MHGSEGWDVGKRPFSRVVIPIGFSLLALIAMVTIGETKPRKKVPALTADGKPNIRSESAYVVDVTNGRLLFAKNADEVREIASTGKIFVAMVVLARGLDLSARTVITEGDRLAATGGARSRLAEGMAFTNQEIMGAMLIGSDNRAATALGRAVGLSPAKLVDAMGELADDLGLSKTSFGDPSGLTGNFSTAREMSQALAKAMTNPVISRFLSAKRFEVRLPTPIRGQKVVVYYNTNELLHREPEIVGGKTGFNTAAGYCLLVAARAVAAGSGESSKTGLPIAASPALTAIFLGADGKKTRFADYRRLRQWLQDERRLVGSN